MADHQNGETLASNVRDLLRGRWLGHSQILLGSFHRCLGRHLIVRSGDAADEALRLFGSSFAVLSHGTEADPILNYANRTALQLWELSTEQLVMTPSRLTAEPVNREARQRFLQQANRQGFVEGYEGVRISARGRRFLIQNAIIWNVTSGEGAPLGQAATFDRWTPVA